MRRSCRMVLTLCVLIAASSSPAGAAVVASKINHVTLFANRALVQRTGQLPVEAGVQQLDIAVDAFEVDSDSVSAKVYGQGEIYSVQFRRRPKAEAPQKAIRRLEEQIRELESRRQALTDQKNRLANQRRFLDSVVTFSQTQVPTEIQTQLPEAAHWQEILSFLQTNYQRIDAEGLPLDSQQDQLDRELKKRQRELANLQRHGGNKSDAVIEVLFRSARAQQLRLEVSYTVARAYWTPLYRASVTNALKGVDLTMFAKIHQKTGESWSQAQLTISNAVPLKGAHLPRLHPWYLDMPRPVLRRSKKARAPAAAMEADAIFETQASGGALKLKEEVAQFAGAQIKQSSLAFEYALPAPIDISSQDRETILPLMTRPLTGQFHHLAVPKRSPWTFLVCQSAADTELMSGPLNLYMDGAYVGKTQLEQKRAGEKLELNLGADRQVRVKRLTITDRVKETFFGKIDRETVQREVAYRLSAENLKAQPVHLQLFDQLPVSKTDKIEVKDVKVTPEPSERDVNDRKGVLRWDLQIQPGEQKTVDIAFTVAYPKNFRWPMGR